MVSSIDGLMMHNSNNSLSSSLSVRPWLLVFNRQRWLVVTTLLAVILFSWAYLWHIALNMKMMDMSTSSSLKVPVIHAWTSLEFFYMFIMWAIMMVGMMLPSAAPMILTYATIGKNQKQYQHTLSFSMGYLSIWSLFSLIATLLQWALEQAALLSASMVSQSPMLGASLLIIAGLYQFSPLKNNCLTQCRSPFQFIMTRLRPGTKGAFLMGIKHGAFCLACCGFLMTLLFVGGVMNLVWIASITFFVLLEKSLPFGEKSTWLSGSLLILSGSLFLIYA